MSDSSAPYRGYAAAAALGAVGGGLAVAAITRAIPGMMSHMMSGKLQNMMAQMAAGGCDPEQI